MSYLNNGIEYSHNIYQKILEEYKNSLSAQPPSVNEEPEHTHFLGAFHEQMSRKKDEQSFYTTPQFNFLMADLWGAGVDTTITTLRWFFLYLAHHQNFQVHSRFYCLQNRLIIKGITWINFFRRGFTKKWIKFLEECHWLLKTSQICPTYRLACPKFREYVPSRLWASLTAPLR